MRSDTHLDWLAVTFPIGTAHEDTFPPRALVGAFHWEAPGRHGYANLYQHPNGLQVMDGGTESQGVHAIATGQALANMRDAGVPDWLICYNATFRRGRASRLDIALNLVDTNLTVEDFWRAWQAGHIETPARGARLITSHPVPGSSLYLGSRQSSIMMRIYDKAAEQNVQDEVSWLRLEAELKKVRANATMLALASTDNEHAVMRATIADGIQWRGCSELEAALADTAPVEIRLPRKVTGTEAWLVNQVAPAMAKWKRAHPDSDPLELLSTAYRNALNIRP